MTTKPVVTHLAVLLHHHIHHTGILVSVSVARVLVEVGLVALGVVAVEGEEDMAIDEMALTREGGPTIEDLMDQEAHHHMENIQRVNIEKPEKVLQTDMVAGAAVDMVAEEDMTTDEEDGEAMGQGDHHHHLVVMVDQEGLI